MAALTVGGLAGATVSGAALGAAGGLAIPHKNSTALSVSIVALCALGIARDVAFPHSALLQPRRQTHEAWGKRRPRALGAFMWGFDLGLVVTTWFTFAGPLIVIALAFDQQSAWAGATLMSAYWLGRAASTWFAPLLLLDANATPGLLAWLQANRNWFRFSQAGAMAWIVAALATQAL